MINKMIFSILDFDKLINEYIENKDYKILESGSHPDWESIGESLDFLFYESEKRFINRN